MRASVSLCLALVAGFPPADGAAREGRTLRVDGLVMLQSALASARPGDRIEVAPGTYEGGVYVTGLAGTQEHPVIVTAADPQHRPVFEGGGSGLHFSDPVWLVLEDLVLQGATGNGLNVDDGGSIDTPASGIVLRRIVVRDVGPEGNCDGIKLSGVERFRVEDCVVERWGMEGSGIDMVGCHDGVITGCTLRHERGKGANGIQGKGGTARIRLERCTFEEAGLRAVQLGGSTGPPYFRPPLAARGNVEASEMTVTGCRITGSDAAIAFVGATDCLVQACTIRRPHAWVVRILQETRGPAFLLCARGRFEENDVAWNDGDLRTTVNVGDGTEPSTFVFARNRWRCLDAPEKSVPRLPTPERD